MPVYVMLTRLTSQGAQTLKHNPQRIMDVDQQLAGMGLKILDQYAVLGRYDFVNIVEAPDDATIARISLELSSRGSIHIETMRGVPVGEFVAGLKKEAVGATAGG